MSIPSRVTWNGPQPWNKPNKLEYPQICPICTMLSPFPFPFPSLTGYLGDAWLSLALTEGLLGVWRL